MARSGLWLALICGAAAIIVGAVLIATPLGHSHFFNLAWSSAFSQAFWQGAVYPRHLPALWGGLGGLDLVYYPPLPFWITELLARPVCLGCNDAQVLGLGGGILLLLSGAAFYGAARAAIGTTLSAGGALAGALVYMAMPYHLWIEWFHRQALGEFAAYIAVPAVMFGFVSVLRGGSGVLLAMGWTGLLLTHLPSALLAGHLIAVLTLVWVTLHVATRQGGLWPCVIRGLAATAAGFAIAALFWLPAMALLGDVSVSMLYSTTFDPEQWLFLDGVDAPSPKFERLLILILGAGTLAALAVGWLAKDRRSAVVLVALPIALTVFAMSALARPIWTGWFIDLVQFPWRMLIFADFAVAAAVALAVQARPWRSWPVSVRIVPMAAVLAATALALPDSVARVKQAPDYGQEPIRIGGATEYAPPTLLAVVGATPLSSHREVELALMDLSERIRGDSEIIQGTLSYRSFAADIPMDQAEVTLAIPYWQHWQGGEGVVLAPDPPTGMTQATVPQGTQQLVLTLPWHWSEWLGLAATLAGLAGLVILVIRRPAPLAAGAEDRI